MSPYLAFAVAYLVFWLACMFAYWWHRPSNKQRRLVRKDRAFAFRQVQRYTWYLGQATFRAWRGEAGLGTHILQLKHSVARWERKLAELGGESPLAKPFDSL